LLRLAPHPHDPIRDELRLPHRGPMWTIGGAHATWGHLVQDRRVGLH
jgi:hypothetical protein